MTSSTLKERVQATLKSEDTEGTFELYVTRTPGYLWALLFKKLHIHPIAVTLLSIVIGALAGYFFWWDDLYMNLIGMFLLIWANWYDCADGQLARMTGQKTLIGRILDGFAGDVWFFSIYFFLCLRLTGIQEITEGIDDRYIIRAAVTERSCDHMRDRRCFITAQFPI